MIMLLIASVAILSAALVWDNAVPIRQGVNIEWFRTGVETLDGGAIYVWSDTKLGERDLWAQKVDASGNLVWGEPLLVDGKIDRQEDPVIARTTDGNYIIAWIEFAFDLDGDVYAQKINDDGDLLWEEGGVPVCTYPGIQIGLNMEPDMDGGAFIIWGDSRNPSKDLFAQRISSSGAPLWTVDGIPIADGPGDEVQNTMLPDGQGGMMIAYTSTFVGDSDIYAKHFDENGNMTWDAALPLAVAPGDQNGVRMAALTGGEFVFTWTDQRNDDPDIYAQKLNIDGDMLWDDPFIVYADQDQEVPVPQRNPRIQATSDNAAVIVWEDNRLDLQDADLFAQKLAADGSKLWGDNGIALSTAPFAQIGQRMAADDNGGVYVVWDDLRNGNSPNDDIYAQHLDADGTALWGTDGKPICTQANTQSGCLVKVSEGNVFINWMDMRNGSVGIYYQVLDPTGNTMLDDDGELVFWGLSGDTPKGQYKIVPRGDNNLIVWQDTRFANQGVRIYYQILTEDGETLLETNGRPVTLLGEGSQRNPQAAGSPDGHVAIVWIDDRAGSPNIFAQLISPSGDRLWGDNGIKMTEDVPLGQRDPMVSYHDGGFNFGWSNWNVYGTTYRYHVYGQRIEDGVKMWGADGVMVSFLEGDDQIANENRLAHLVEDYYVWSRVHPASGSEYVEVRRMANDGQSAPGWNDAGMGTTEGLTGLIVNRSPVAQVTPHGIYIAWQDFRTWIMRYYGQHISSSGARLWNPEGVNLSASPREQELATATVTDNGIITAWCENVAGNHDIMAQKFSFTGEKFWGELGYEVVQKDSTQSHPSIVSFNDNGMMVTWTDYMALDSDIYFDYINNNGELIHGSGGAVLTDAGKAQYEPLATVMNNNAYVIWADGRSSGKTEILGLYAQKASNATVSIDFPEIPAAPNPKLGQNFPNPFNPHTNIALNMPQRGSVELKIYNSKGQLVKSLFTGDLEQGLHSFTWDGRDNNDRSVSSGVYFYSVESGSYRESRKMLLMK